MKLRRRGYKFRPYRVPRPRQHLNEWQGWNVVAVLILVIVLAIVIRACCG